MGEKSILFQCIVTKGDYNTLRFYYMYKQKLLRTRILVYIFLISLILLVLSDMTFAFPFQRMLGLIGMLVVTGIYSWIVIEVRRIENNVKKFVNLKQEMNLADGGFTVKWAGYEQTEFSWDEVDHVVESDAYFYLFTEPDFAIIMPKLIMKEFMVKQIHDLFEKHITLVSEMSGWKARKI